MPECWALAVRLPAAARLMAAGLRAAGIDASPMPLQSVRRARRSARLDAQIASAASATVQIYVSSSAVTACSVLAPELLHRRCQRLAVGAATAAALREHGVDCLAAPSGQEDSEGLLALPELAELRPGVDKVLILAAPGGRNHLADSLRARGLAVDCLPVYQRVARAPPPEILERLQREGSRSRFLVGSGGLLRRLDSELTRHGLDDLRERPLVVPSERVAREARDLRFQQVRTAAGASVGAMVAALLGEAWEPVGHLEGTRARGHEGT